MTKATEASNLLPGARAAFLAWLYLSTTRPWIESLMVNHITERKNNPEVVKGGGYTQRMAMKKIADLGGTVETLDPNTRVHMVADIDHSNLFEPVFERYLADERTARDSLAIDRAYRGTLASAMMEIGESQAL